MMELNCNNVKLFYKEKGKGDTALLFIHNTGGDHRLFTPQLEYFYSHFRVINVDLRGHGASEKPPKNYGIEVFAEDLESLCKQLSLEKIIAVGSSTGGNVALEMACRYPDLIKAVVMIDSALFLSASVKRKIREYQDGLKGINPLDQLLRILEDSCLSTDRCKMVMLEAYKVVPAYVWNGVFTSLLKWDRNLKTCLEKCKAPLLYIEACSLDQDRSHLVNYKKVFRVFPSLLTGKVVGSGHYPSLEVPDQINAMILQFLRVKGFI